MCTVALLSMRCSTASPAAAVAAPPRDVVLLLHGLGRTAWSMRPLAGSLARQGYDARCSSYPSFSPRIDVAGAQLARELARLDADPAVARVHLVGHSLGGIVIRRALCDGVPAKLGRVVLLTPPNRGSPVARRLAPWLGRWFPILHELSDAPTSRVNALPPPAPGVECAVIACTWDAKTPIAVTRLDGAVAHQVVRGTHSTVMLQPGVARAVAAFLGSGRLAAPAKIPADA